ncbi:MAG: hypothetical protein AB7R69_04680 [Candidatus Babeliales bacterium]
MMGHGMKCFVGHAICFLTSLAAFNIGLTAMGHNLFDMGFLHQFAMPIAYIFGLAGAAGLVMWVMHTFFCNCGCSSCGCGGK